MARLFKEIPRLLRALNVIEQYDNFVQLGAKEDIDYLRDKAMNLYNLVDDPETLVVDFTYCAKMVNMYYDEIDPEFKQKILEEEREKEEDEF